MNPKYKTEYESLEWQRRRLEILARDKNTCQTCGVKNNLHVHHKKYDNNLRCWEYPDEYLVTLCANCHEKVHLNKSTDSFYSREKIEKYKFYVEPPPPKLSDIKNGLKSSVKSHAMRVFLNHDAGMIKYELDNINNLYAQFEKYYPKEWLKYPAVENEIKWREQEIKSCTKFKERLDKRFKK